MATCAQLGYTHMQGVKQQQRYSSDSLTPPELGSSAYAISVYGGSGNGHTVCRCGDIRGRGGGSSVGVRRGCGLGGGRGFVLNITILVAGSGGSGRTTVCEDDTKKGFRNLLVVLILVAIVLLRVCRCLLADRGGASSCSGTGGGRRGVIGIIVTVGLPLG